MIKVSKLEEAQALVRQRLELRSRLQLMRKRDRGWEEQLVSKVSFDTIFGNDDSRSHEEALDCSAEFHEAAKRIAEIIEQYLNRELSSVEAKLQGLGVDTRE